MGRVREPRMLPSRNTLESPHQLTKFVERVRSPCTDSTHRGTLHAELTRMHRTRPKRPARMRTCARCGSSLRLRGLALRLRLRRLAALHRAVLDEVEACVVLLDGQGSVRCSNQAAKAHFGTALAGGSLPTLLAPTARAALRGALERARAGEPQRQIMTRRRSDRVDTMSWTVTPVDACARNGDGPLLLAVGHDVSGSVEFERRGSELRAMAMMGSLATSLAHEIRNPLNAANLQLELLVRRAKRAAGDDGAEAIDEPAAQVRAEIARLGTLLDDFLQLARPRLPVRVRCKVEPLLREVVALEQARAAAARVSLTCAVSEPDLSARIDVPTLKQALVSLIDNGIDALAARCEGSIVLRAEPRPEGGVSFEVADDGSGIGPELADGPAFEPFVTTKPAGTGLGLAIVRKIVAQHDGEVRLQARPEGGTRVRFWVSD